MAQSQFITDLLKSLKSQYQAVIDDAVEFYEQFDSLYGVYARETDRVKEIEQQLHTIKQYKAKHGVYPQIKDQANTEDYIQELLRIKAGATEQIDEVEPEVLAGYQKRRQMLDKIAFSIADMMLNHRDASMFIATMVLRAPMPNDHTRCATNEKSKPIYIAALSVCLLQKLIEQEKITNSFIVSRVPKQIPNPEHPEQTMQDPEQVKEYIQQVLSPLITGVLIHNIGSYSKTAEAIYKGNRFRLLEENDRKLLVKAIFDHSQQYLKFGLGKPQQSDFPDPTEYQLQQAQYLLTKEIICNYPNAQHPVGNLLRIPMIYASFLLSTKPEFNYLTVFKAYEILQGGIEKKVIYGPFAKVFLDLVGMYPLGTGIFFISNETHLPERAVVTGLEPSKPTSAIVKQLTRRQIKFDDHTQVEASKESIISNPQTRKDSDFGTDYYKKQYPNGFFWNPSEPWERDIDHQKFWRRDNKLKLN